MKLRQRREVIGGHDPVTAISLASRLSQTTTRRSFVGRVGKLTLAIVGIQVVVHGPVLRVPGPEVNPAEAVGPCGDWRWCGLCGTRCNNPECNGGIEFCPPGTKHNNQGWTRCCCETQPPNNCRLMKYHDCCARSDDGVNQVCSATACDSTNGGWCGSWISTWCMPNVTPPYNDYFCSLAIDQGEC